MKPRYRYQNPGGTIGGPLLIPGVRFNKDRNRLFFFFSYDKLYNSTVANNTYTMPTALERAGDPTVNEPGEGNGREQKNDREPRDLHHLPAAQQQHHAK